jgi:aspartate/methionine/tyrosine aminotransferase
MFLIETIGVAPVPGEGFYDSGSNGAEYLRFTFVRSLGLLQDAALRLAQLADYDENGVALVGSSL